MFVKFRFATKDLIALIAMLRIFNVALAHIFFPFLAPQTLLVLPHLMQCIDSRPRRGRKSPQHMTVQKNG